MGSRHLDVLWKSKLPRSAALYPVLERAVSNTSKEKLMAEEFVKMEQELEELKSEFVEYGMTHIVRK